MNDIGLLRPTVGRMFCLPLVTMLIQIVRSNDKVNNEIWVKLIGAAVWFEARFLQLPGSRFAEFLDHP